MNRLTRAAIVVTVALLLGLVLAQSTYADPQGRFVTPVPNGWTLATDGDVVTFRHTDPIGALHVLSAATSEDAAVAQALASLVAPELDATFAAAPLQSTPVALPSGLWTQRVYGVDEDLVVVLSHERGDATVVVLAQGTQAVFVETLNAATNEVVLGLEVTIAEPAPAPATDLTYATEEVTFASGDVTLAGVLSRPKGEGPYPAVALVSGSGAQDRDGANPAVPGYEPLRWLADQLASSGFAVLRWDERGIGASTGDHAAATSADLADDLEAGVTYLLGRPDVAPDRVGVLGHSEGASLAAMVAARSSDVAFVIVMAPPSVPYTVGVLKQVELAAIGAGLDAAAVDRAVAQQARVVELALAEDWAGLEAFLLEVYTADAETLTDAQRASIGDVDALVASQAAAGAEAFQTPWLNFYLNYDPQVDWSKVTVPVLALFAGRDVQVDLAQNRAPLADALAAAGNDDVTIVTFEEANHLFQRAETGGLDEYLRLEMAFVPGLLDQMTAWLQERFMP